MAADGAGHGTPDGHALFPALWGSDSFNCGAGMGRISSATAFVKANMPLGLPGTLTDQQGCGTWGYMNRPGAAARPALHRQRAGNTMHHHPTDLLQLDQQFLLTA
jgi:cytochrome c